ncbi:hypothetical protein [Oleiharenicola sp. Vm1]|uniref:hypothetical protein n=1 Tax=Oleiharenicola sp. Vm1 TaxID=3398393 RepID=UPI0039F4FF2F
MNSTLPPVLPPRSSKPAKGYFSPRAVRTASFYITSLCIVASAVTCILAIWNFTRHDSLWRLIASFVVVAAGTGLFSAVNTAFGEERDN